MILVMARETARDAKTCSTNLATPSTRLAPVLREWIWLISLISSLIESANSPLESHVDLGSQLFGLSSHIPLWSHVHLSSHVCWSSHHTLPSHISPGSHVPPGHPHISSKLRIWHPPRCLSHVP